MLRILMECWPALLPLLIFALWLRYRRRRARRLGLYLPPLLHPHWLWAIGAALLILLACLFWLGLSADSNQGTHYAPKQFKDGKLIQEHLE